MVQSLTAVPDTLGTGGSALAPQNGGTPTIASLLKEHRAALLELQGGKAAPDFTARFATTANLNLATTGLTAIDGVTPVAGDTAFVKDQSTGAQNGLYVVSAGAWTRLKDGAGNDVLKEGMVVVVAEGTVNADTLWELSTNAPITVDTTSLSFVLLVAPPTASATKAIPLMAAILAAGTPMAAFADNAASQPGVTLADSKSVGIRWNDAATQVAVFVSFTMPDDIDTSVDAEIDVIASKTGATGADAVTFDVGLFKNAVGALHDADTGIGGTTSAMTGAAVAKTVQKVTLAVAHAGLGQPSEPLTLSIKPTNGTLSTDDVIVEAVLLKYKRKVKTS